MKGRPISYTQEELAWIKARAQDPRRETHVEFVARFGREDVALGSFNALCKRKGWLTGRTGRFEKGLVPANKGQPMPFHPNSAATRFRKGNAPANLKPLWHERVGKDGYLEMKVPIRNPYTGHSTRYMHKHRYLWEQANGPLPKGMALKCLDGNKLNTGPENWEAIPKALLPRLNGRFGRDYDAAPGELKPTIMAIVKLEHRARTVRKGRAR